MNLSRNSFCRALALTALTPLVFLVGLILLVLSAVNSTAGWFAARFRRRSANRPSSAVPSPDDPIWQLSAHDERTDRTSPDPSAVSPAQAAQPVPSSTMPKPSSSSLLSKPNAKPRRHL